MKHLKVSVIIPVVREHYLKECIDALRAQTMLHDEFEIVFIGSENLNKNIFTDDLNIRWVVEENPHPGLRRNCAVNSCPSQFIAFLDDDSRPTENWLSRGIAFLEYNECHGVRGPIIARSPLPTLDRGIAAFLENSFFLEGFRLCDGKDKEKLSFYNISFNGILLKKDVWEIVGGINENASYYIDDTEFFYLAEKKGCFFLFLKDIPIYHLVETFPIAYLYKKMINRFNTGKNAALFYEVYLSIPSITIAIIGVSLVLLGCFLIKEWLLALAVIFIAYMSVISFAILKSCSRDEKKISYWVGMFAFLTSHIVILCSFISGLFVALLCYFYYGSIREHKRKRFQINSRNC